MYCVSHHFVSELKKRAGILLVFKYYDCLIWKLVVKLLSSSSYNKRFSASLPKEKAFSEHVFMLLHLDTWFYKLQLFLYFLKVVQIREGGGREVGIGQCVRELSGLLQFSTPLQYRAGCSCPLRRICKLQGGFILIANYGQRQSVQRARFGWA